MSIRTLIARCLVYLCALFTGLPAFASSPEVTVSIKPLHSLVAGMMNGAGDASLIVKGSRSPHTYSLKPSDARTLSSAGIVVWAGAGMEMFLEKPINALSAKSLVLTLSDDAAADPHIWLSPALAGTIVDKVLAALLLTDPDHADQYRENARSLKSRLGKLQAYGERRLQPFQHTPFLVFHDAWGHFATAFGLNITGAVALNPERPASAKRIIAIRHLIEESGARCLFKEPQFASPLLTTIVEGHEEIRVRELDPLGSTFKPGPDLYFQMMENNIDAVASCLK
jgi:zinc transport system substrate-binding protein